MTGRTGCACLCPDPGDSRSNERSFEASRSTCCSVQGVRGALLPSDDPARWRRAARGRSGSRARDGLARPLLVGMARRVALVARMLLVALLMSSGACSGAPAAPMPPAGAEAPTYRATAPAPSRATPMGPTAPEGPAVSSAALGPLEAALPPEFPHRTSVEALDQGTRSVTVHRDGGVVMTISSDDLFDPGSARLAPRARWRLDGIPAALSAQVGQDIFVRAYTDALGDAAESTALSLRRAEAVCEYFAGQGVPSDLMRAEGLGGAHPVADNHTR